MATVISNGNTTLATASGFYRVEAANLNAFSETVLALTSTRTIAVTFANAGDCQGVVLALTSSTSTTTKDVTVVLQEDVAGVWTDRATQTITAANISAYSNTSYGTYFTSFAFGTPYTVTTASLKWRFSVTQSVAGTLNWNLKTSDGTNPFYVTWCNNAISYTSGDVVIAKDTVTIDMNATFTGVLGTGDATRSICAVACSNSDTTQANVCRFVWASSPAAAYTLTIDGYFILSANSGFRVGTSASPIPANRMAEIVVDLATSGTATNTGFSDSLISSTGYGGRMSIFMYGAVPTYQRTTLASDAASGQPNIVTVDSTGWAVNDEVVVCKPDTTSTPTVDLNPLIISAIAGTAITLTSNIATYTRLAGGHVFRLNGYGVKYWFNGAVNTSNVTKLFGINSYVFSGVQMQGLQINSSNGTAVWNGDPTDVGGLSFIDGSYRYLTTTAAGAGAWLQTTGHPSSPGLITQRVNFLKAGLSAGTMYGPQINNQTLDCVFNGPYNGAGGFIRIPGVVISNNAFYNAVASAINNGAGFSNVTIHNNTIWGCATGIRVDGAAVNVVWSDNVIDSSTYGFFLLNAAINFVITGGSIGLTKAVTNVFYPFSGYGVFAQMVMRDTNLGTYTYLVLNMTASVNGSYIATQNTDLLTNDDRYYATYGEIWRTGTGLADTTVRTAGGFAMRFEPNSATDALYWTTSIPTGSIQNKTMTISLWVYINNIAYASGSHTKPTLTVTYDQTSIATSVATATYGSWQQLAVIFTPVTTYGQVTMKVTGATDAVGTNRYFYVDDVNVAYPAGVAVNLGGLDLWADGLPIAPAISTVPSLGGVWDEALAAHTVAGSFGAFVKKLLTVAKFLGLK